MGKWLKKHLITIILVLIMLVGVGIMAYPTVSDWWNKFHMTRAISQYVDQVDNMDEEEIQEQLEKAQAYNEKLLQTGNLFEMTDEQVAEYNSILDVAGNGVMGYIQIDSIGVNLPIYHGTDENVLQIAVGHLSGTSLPIGGESTHAVLSGHRGLPSARLFTDLDQLEEGDTFTVTVLDQTITYEVDQIRIVLPEDTSELQLVSGEDYCTLVTCTPYGVNTHRLLVRGHRIENAKGLTIVTAEAVKIPTYLVIPAVLIPMLFLLLVIMLIYYRVRKPRYSEEELKKMFL